MLSDPCLAGVAVGVVFGLAFSILSHSGDVLRWRQCFRFQPGIFLGGGCGGCGGPSVGSVAALVGVSWTGSGVAFGGCSGGPLVGAVTSWRILGSSCCCCCFLLEAAVVVALVLWVGRCRGLAGGCVLLSPSCLRFLGFGRVFRVVSRAPELSKLRGNIIKFRNVCSNVSDFLYA